ncbi:MAG: hypothetical protein P1P85_01755 [Patescibacteria group bacterium]|nr:hypothetical protein [Patescibacteria group bacterium]
MKTKKILILFVIVILFAITAKSVSAEKESIKDGSWKVNGPYPDIIAEFIYCWPTLGIPESPTCNVRFVNYEKVDYEGPFDVIWNVDGEVVYVQEFDGSYQIFPGSKFTTYFTLYIPTQGSHKINISIELSEQNLYEEKKTKDNNITQNYVV